MANIIFLLLSIIGTILITYKVDKDGTEQHAIVAAMESTVEYNRAKRWAQCMGLFDAIALARSGDVVDFGDAMDSGPGKIEWNEWGEWVRDDIPYGKAWLPVRAAAIHGLDTLVGPDRAAHLALFQLAEFAEVLKDMDNILVTDGSENIGMVTRHAPPCFDLYDELVAEGVINIDDEE